MRRPWIEATALMSGAGFAPPPPPPATFTDALTRRYGPLAAESILTHRRPAMLDTSTVRYAILPHTDPRQAKPKIFERLRHLAQYIHTERDGGGLELEKAPLLLAGSDTPLNGVSVWKSQDNQRGAYIGWCWLDGGDDKALEGVLFELEPSSGAGSQFAEDAA